MKRIILFFLVILFVPKIMVLLTGCAQIVAPTGGPRDTLPPKLVSSNPKNGATNFHGNRITLDFNEYIQLDNIQQNLLVSPTPKNNPYIDGKLRTVTIRLRDTLEPNTTYTFNLGNSIKDINENNVVQNFVFVFSSGPTLDSMELSGNVSVAETGSIDSTLIVMLYKNTDDSAVIKQKPKYITRLNGTGDFRFTNLAPGMYKVYALKDANGSRTYDNKAEMFAFADTLVKISNDTKEVKLFAYVEEPEVPKVPSNNEKKLRYTTKVTQGQWNILSDLIIDFNKPLKNFDPQKIMLADTLNNINKSAVVFLDSTNKRVRIKNKWTENTAYKLIISKDFATDTTGLALTRSDTLKFTTKKETDYGNIKLHFTNLNKYKNPVLEFVVGNEVVNSYPLTSADWSAKLFIPGDYDLRILNDDNSNGKWDPGNFILKRQPEKGYTVPKKITIKANWENDIDIEL